MICAVALKAVSSDVDVEKLHVEEVYAEQAEVAAVT
jgi:hypothetical protein